MIVHTCMWQSCIEIKYYSATYFNCVYHIQSVAVLNFWRCIDPWTINEAHLPTNRPTCYMLCKVTHCAGCVSANIRPHQLHWGDHAHVHVWPPPLTEVLCYNTTKRVTQMEWCLILYTLYLGVCITYVKLHCTIPQPCQQVTQHILSLRTWMFPLDPPT